MKRAIEDDRFSYDYERSDKKNSDTQYLLEYSNSQVVTEFSSLQIENYRYGPFEDKNFPDDCELWEFKKKIQGYIIYFKVMKITSQNWFLGISFHEDEY